MGVDERNWSGLMEMIIQYLKVVKWSNELTGTGSNDFLCSDPDSGPFYVEFAWSSPCLTNVLQSVYLNQSRWSFVGILNRYT